MIKRTPVKHAGLQGFLVSAMEPMERRAYSTWNNLHLRCKTTNAVTRKKYSGITACERWTGLPNGFLAFIEDMGLPPTSKHSIDRIDNAKGYFKENCRWATAEEQVANRRNTILVEIDGKKYTSRQIQRIYGIGTGLLWARLKAGKTGAELIAPKNSHIKKYDVGGGRMLTIAEIAKEVGCTIAAIHRRLNQGLSGAELLAPSSRAEKPYETT